MTDTRSGAFFLRIKAQLADETFLHFVFREPRHCQVPFIYQYQNFLILVLRGFMGVTRLRPYEFTRAFHSP